MPNPSLRQPMKLHLVFLLGFLASVGVICGLIYVFAAYEAADPWPLTHNPRISQDRLFEVIRNAVTTAAALGVGIALFFSYRRQQTAEQTARIGVEAQAVAAEAQATAAKAQATAAAALELSNKQHSLDQDRRKDAVITELRTRYAKTAEQLGSNQLAVRLAGIYSLAALADDWADVGNDDERQVCVDLLGAYFRSSPLPEDDSARAEIVAATIDAVTARIGRGTPERMYWGRCRLDLANPGPLPNLKNVLLQDGGSLQIRGATQWSYASASDIQLLNGGTLAVEGTAKTEYDYASFNVNKLQVVGGRMSVSLDRMTTSESEPTPGKGVVVRNSSLEGGVISIYAPGWRVQFMDCVFKSDIFKNVWGDKPIAAASVAVKDDCRFENDARVLESFGSYVEDPF